MSRTLLRGAQVVSMVPGRADVEVVDVLVDGAIIVDTGTDLDDAGAEVVDVPGRILIPGLVNAHLHTWQTALRCVGVDWTLHEYLTHVHGNTSEYYEPDDVHIGSHAGALNQIGSGTTTLGDWCHNIPTHEHADAAIDAIRISGIRAVFLDGRAYRQPGAHPPEALDRLIDSLGSTDLLTAGLAIKGPQYSAPDVALADLRAANERDVVVSMHHSGGEPVNTWDTAFDAGLIGTNTNIVHGTGMSPDWVTKLVDAGATFTSTPENELGQGPGLPVIDALIRCGGAPSLGTDIDSVVPGDVLSSARIALAHQRGVDHSRRWNESRTMASSPSVTAKQALSWATVEGARALGLSDQIGRIEPGMRADLVLIDAGALNLWPAHDPIAAALHAHAGNIEAVMIDGRWRKRDHHLLDVDLEDVRSRLLVSGQRLLRDAHILAPAG